MLKEVHRYHVHLELISGMHITGSDNTFDIGGADSQVIKNPLTGEPYIPGSSLKGKLRSLLDYRYGSLVGEGNKMDYKVTNGEHQPLLCLFEPVDGYTPMVTRGIFRDLRLTDDAKALLTRILGEGVYTEIKAENTINRFQGKAANPRFIERVPAGASFDGEIDILEFDGDPYEKIYHYLEEAIEMLNHHFIGGSGSRGYGQVRVTIKEMESVRHE